VILGYRFQGQDLTSLTGNLSGLLIVLLFGQAIWLGVLLLYVPAVWPRAGLVLIIWEPLQCISRHQPESR
jgi:hypothetical protein